MARTRKIDNELSQAFAVLAALTKAKQALLQQLCYDVPRILITFHAVLLIGVQRSFLREIGRLRQTTFERSHPTV